MAKAKKKNKKMGKAGKRALAACGVILLLLCLVMVCAAINANIIRVRRAELTIRDLPDSFEGMTILYASDIDLCGLNTADKAGALFSCLQAMSPDVLILGGDYTSHSVFEMLNSPDAKAQNTQSQLQKRSDFFHYISDFNAPMGKYAIASPEDPDWSELKQVMEANGVYPLFNQRVALTIGEDMLWLVGFSSDGKGTNHSVDSVFSHEDCVVALSYSPELLPYLLTIEASNSGTWADLILCGHTHGGQIRLFGHSILQLSHIEQQYISGWAMDNGQPILTTEGLGCEGANMRIGSAPEVWMITLHKVSS